MMMKGDVLSGLKKIKVCVKYNYNGKEISHYPFTLEDNLKPVFQLIEILRQPYTQHKDILNYQAPSPSNEKYQTFCGT